MTEKIEQKITNLQQLSLPQSFFVYGTLRDDNDSGARWTAKWTKNISFACPAKVYGFKMFQCKKLNYPFALRTGNKHDVIVGRFVTFHDANVFNHKLMEADKIEHYDATQPDHEENAYVRDIVDVELVEPHHRIREEFFGAANDDLSAKQAIIYYQRSGVSPMAQCVEIPNGDWLDRHLLRAHEQQSPFAKWIVHSLERDCNEMKMNYYTPLSML